MIHGTPATIALIASIAPSAPPIYCMRAIDVATSIRPAYGWLLSPATIAKYDLTNKYGVLSRSNAPSIPLNERWPVGINGDLAAAALGTYNMHTAAQYQRAPRRWNVYDQTDLMWARVHVRYQPTLVAYNGRQMFVDHVVSIATALHKHSSAVSFTDLCMMLYFYYYCLSEYGSVVGTAFANIEKKIRIGVDSASIKAAVVSCYTLLGENKVKSMVNSFVALWNGRLCNDDLMYEMSMNAAFNVPRRQPIYIMSNINLLIALSC